jgi:hypothetical protein
MFRLPNGEEGALWRGLVYPSQKDEQKIDVAGEAFLPSECTGLGGLPAETPRQFVLVWGESEAYLLIGGPPAARDGAMSALRSLGIEIVRTGRYLGDDVEGFVADWFIRFIAESDQRTAIEATLPQVLHRTSIERPTSTELQVRVLRSELADVKLRNAAQVVEINQLRITLAERESSAADEQAAREKNDKAYRIAIEDEKRARVEAEELAKSNELMVSTIQKNSFVRGSKNKISDEIELVLRTFLGRTRLLRDSLIVISAEFSSRHGIYRSLTELESSSAGIPPNWKKVQGLDQWWERHVSTGSDDDGRAYARLEARERTWSVLISHKGQQSRDLNWLARR